MRMDRDRWHLWGGYLRPRDKFLHGKIANLLAVSRVHSAPKNNEVVFGKHLDFLREHQRPKLIGLRGRAPPHPPPPIERHLPPNQPTPRTPAPPMLIPTTNTPTPRLPPTVTPTPPAPPPPHRPHTTYLHQHSSVHPTN